MILKIHKGQITIHKGGLALGLGPTPRAAGSYKGLKSDAK